MTWDEYFMSICYAVAKKSHCLSRNVGAIIVKDHHIISTGYNGPATKVTHCNKRHLEDTNIIEAYILRFGNMFPEEIYECPRRMFGFQSGEGLIYCTGVHAEINAIIQAAKAGVSTKDSSIYCTLMPCKDCLSAIINAGIKEIIVPEYKFYDRTSIFIAESSKIKIRTVNGNSETGERGRSLQTE